MSTKPPLLRVVVVLVLALPGYLLGIIGFGAAIVTALGAGAPGWSWTIGLAFLTGAIVTGTIGSLMVASAGLISGSMHYHRPRNAIAAVVGFEAALLASSALTASAAVGTLASTMINQPFWGWILLFAGAVSLLVMIWRAKKRFFAKHGSHEDAQHLFGQSLPPS